ncbi:unnamed protein product [Paramecium primaurelia]|uniref:Uncharacterized protein n=1 Tax=Paramecium primaurelia TaxID=5886 RepID=A0A8S1PXV0_PARPR|nr:unnamed protein product [Paramecium primaurelia]
MNIILRYFPNTNSIYLIEFKEEGILITEAVAIVMEFRMVLLLVWKLSFIKHKEQINSNFVQNYIIDNQCQDIIDDTNIIVVIIFDTIDVNYQQDNQQKERGRFNNYKIIALFFDTIVVNIKVFLNYRNSYNYWFSISIASTKFVENEMGKIKQWPKIIPQQLF